MIAMTIANFAKFGRATACDLNASSHSTMICPRVKVLSLKLDLSQAPAKKDIGAKSHD
jgi:hypothetical protein